MPKKDSGSDATSAETDTQLIQFNCPRKLAAWADDYAKHVRFTNRTAWLIGLMVDAKEAHERRQYQAGEIMSLPAEQPTDEPKRPAKTPPSPRSNPKG